MNDSFLVGSDESEEFESEVDKILNAPGRIGLHLVGIEEDEQIKIFQALIERLKNDSSVCFDALKEANGDWNDLWLKLESLNEEHHIEIEGMKDVFSRPNLFKFLFDQSVRELFERCIASIDSVDAVRVLVCCSLFDHLRTARWNSLLEDMPGVKTTSVNRWCEDLQKGEVTSLLATPISEFTPLFNEAESLEQFDSYCENSLSGAFAKHSDLDQAIIAYRNQILDQQHLTLGEQIFMAAHFISTEVSGGDKVYDIALQFLEICYEDGEDLSEKILYGSSTQPVFRSITIQDFQRFENDNPDFIEAANELELKLSPDKMLLSNSLKAIAEYAERSGNSVATQWTGWILESNRAECLDDASDVFRDLIENMRLELPDSELSALMTSSSSNVSVHPVDLDEFETVSGPSSVNDDQDDWDEDGFEDDDWGDDDSDTQSRIERDVPESVANENKGFVGGETESISSLNHREWFRKVLILIPEQIQDIIIKNCTVSAIASCIWNAKDSPCFATVNEIVSGAMSKWHFELWLKQYQSASNAGKIKLILLYGIEGFDKSQRVYEGEQPDLHKIAYQLHNFVEGAFTTSFIDDSEDVLCASVFGKNAWQYRSIENLVGDRLESLHLYAIGFITDMVRGQFGVSDQMVADLMHQAVSEAWGRNETLNDAVTLDCLGLHFGEWLEGMAQQTVSTKCEPEKLLDWLVKHDQHPARYLKFRKELAAILYKELNGVGDPENGDSRLALAYIFAAGMKTREILCKEFPVDPQQVDAFYRQFIEKKNRQDWNSTLFGDQTQTEYGTGATSVHDSAIKSVPNEKIKIKSFEFVWPKVAIAVCVAFMVLVPVLYFVLEPKSRTINSSSESILAVSQKKTPFTLYLPEQFRMVEIKTDRGRGYTKGASLETAQQIRDMAGIDTVMLSDSGNVKLSTYWIGKFPVTKEEFTRVFAHKVVSNSGTPTRIDALTDDSGDLPVTGVPYSAALLYCEALTQQIQGQYPDLFAAGGAYEGMKFRLPSEAEWEYAATGGNKSLFWWGDNWESNKRPSLFNTYKSDGVIPTANSNYGWENSPFGLWGIHCGVKEWCSGSSKVNMNLVKGSAWPVEDNEKVYNRSPFIRRLANHSSDTIGFRIVFGK